MMKKLAVAAIVVLALAATTVTVYAASVYTTPAEAVAGLTGRDLNAVIAERVQTGKTYGTMAAEAGKLDQFRAEKQEIWKEQLAARVAAGTMTAERAEAILQAMEKRQAECDGTGAGCGAACRHGAGLGREGGGRGQNAGQGYHGCVEGDHGPGARRRDGSCNDH